MTTVPFDAELKATLDALGISGPDPVSLEMLPAVRTEEAAEGTPSDAELAREGRFTVTEYVTGHVTLLVCLPVGAAGPLPVLYHTHGGGMFTGSHRTGLDWPLDMAERYGAALVSVGYRLAPEDPHPAPSDDVYAGLLWTAANAAELGLDAERIVATGISAGGALTAALALRVREDGGPDLLGQLLRCPMLDDRNDSESVRQMAGVDLWDSAWNEAGWTALLGDARGGPDVSPYAAPARATDLSGLPPAFIEVGSAETLRDEDIAYANRIWQAGGQAELHVWPGGFHAFDLVAPDAALTRDALAARQAWLDRILGAPGAA